MEILMMPNEKILASIGEQPVFANKDYRFMKYCLMTDVNEGKLIFNGLTRTLILLYPEELSELGDINKYDYLYKLYFFVPLDFDEEEVVNKLRIPLLKPIDDLYLNHPKQYTILTTTKCNARCFYCYEMPSKNKHHMSEDTMKKVVKYIVNSAPKSYTINLHWFGGEPLYNQKAIDYITSELMTANIPFTSTFTTNGYLFDKSTILKAKTAWNTTEAQITIDGTEKVYNLVKSYKNSENVNPFKKVMNNIAMLLNQGIAVTIRMNVDQHNAEDLKKFVIETHTRFGNPPHLGMYAWPIFEDEHFHRTHEEHITIFNKLRELEILMENYGYRQGHRPVNEIKAAQCMADDGSSVIISPNGELGTCEHFIDSNFWGHIDDPSKKDFSQLNIWREYNKPLDICKDCPIYPSCVRPTACMEMGKCDEQYKEWRIRKELTGMIHFFEDSRNQGQRPMMQQRFSENVM